MAAVHDRTLVLVDGRRQVSGLIGAAAVDIHTIPTDLAEAIDDRTRRPATAAHPNPLPVASPPELAALNPVGERPFTHQNDWLAGRAS